MSATILPRTAQQEQLHAAFEVSEGRILQVMATAWDADRTSYRVAVERDGAIQIVHRTMRYEETTAANDAIWSLVGRDHWECRPVWRGAGFVAYHPDYIKHLGREGL